MHEDDDFTATGVNDERKDRENTQSVDGFKKMEEKKAEMDNEKWWLAASFLTSQALIATGWLNITSFYPLYVEKMFGRDNINSKMVSIAMNAAEVAGIVGSPLHGPLISAVGQKNAITIGFFINIITSLFMASLVFVPKE